MGRRIAGRRKFIETRLTDFFEQKKPPIKEKKRKGLREFSCRRKFPKEESKKWKIFWDFSWKRSFKKSGFRAKLSLFFSSKWLSWHVGLFGASCNDVALLQFSKIKNDRWTFSAALQQCYVSERWSSAALWVTALSSDFSVCGLGKMQCLLSAVLPFILRKSNREWFLALCLTK